ncbi:MAG: DUF4011 domain-containing protein [Bacteroidales bacterium]|nr:DUF4011 domain-containing protein [Candidatus Sodaliphilus aphodohippi]
MAFSKFTLQNDSSDEFWNEVEVTITGDLLEPCQMSVACLKPGQHVSFDDANLMPVASKLMALTEAVQTSFSVTLKIAGETALQQSLPVMLMAFDQWHGLTVMPELLAAYVTPNHPGIAQINNHAAQYIKDNIGTMDAYALDPKDLMDQIEAVYKALLDEHINYVTAPTGFEPVGQRIRLADKVLKDKIGNCIDLSLLLCSCLESMGFRTVMLLFETHATMGVWLDRYVSVPMVGTASTIEDYTHDDDCRLLMIEATALTGGKTFEEAIELGEMAFANNKINFECYIDILSARRQGVRPLPHCVQSDQGWTISDNTDYDALLKQLSDRGEYDIHGTQSDDNLRNKQKLWERKLLDLSLRNNLLNMRTGKRIVPLKGIAVEEVFAHLKAGQLSQDVEQNSDKDEAVKELYRAARTSIEENGANTLFLAVGKMRWYEVDNKKPHYAPVMFLPLEIVRHSARKYIIRCRDEEPLMNITLMEMMRQMFDLILPPISPVSDDENELIAWKQVFAVLNKVLEEVNEKQPEDAQWQIEPECMIGIFSFSKFVMWNDIHSNPDVLGQHLLLRSFMNGRLMLPENAEGVDMRMLDHNAKPADFAVPVDADSSQLEAVVNSGKGYSFILYGPPGTGKSQTITNIIANALYQNKRVLFVAEKKAALEVVQERLGRIGLDPFCLELHSNKVDKKSFLAQMEMALDAPAQAPSRDFTMKSEALYQRRQQLNDYIEALYAPRAEGLSLYDFINRYLEIEGEYMHLKYDDIKHLKIEQVKEISEQCAALDTVQDIIGIHAGQHPLLGLYPRENTAANQQQVIASMAQLPEAIAAARKKEQGLLNRWFFKRTALEILQRRHQWDDFFAVADTDVHIKEDIDVLESKIENWNKETDRLRLWYHYSLRARDLKGYSVPAVLDYYLDGHSGRQTADAFVRGYYLRMALQVLDTDTALRSFNGMLFADIIKKYRELAREFAELTRQELVCRLSQRIPHVEQADKQTREELTFLRKRIAAHGRAYSVRRMLDGIRHILPQLCPCMLMSPLSVAQYLEMEPDQFDLVLFDEASQMPTSEAVGAIARGKATIVVGDPKQMPPTSFFDANSTNEDDAEIDDLESILDDCISMSMPGYYLSCHYRSKHESLIAFSNTNFYDSRLITFPSVDDQQRKVTLQHVNGVYDYGRTRSNKAEADAIVAEVIDRLERMLPGPNGEAPAEPVRSIGIVAFSKVQSGLIEDKLLDALSKNHDLERLALKGDEPIFIKNLENVQGDERDIIFFSVGYGPDKNGKVSMNFGPLNQVGGERRLNVAVSRARYEMKVFSTLEPQQIDMQRTSAKGVAALKRFLEYAETGTLPCPAAQQDAELPSLITDLIAQEYRSQGYEVHTNVGKSKFKVDIAIVDKNNPGQYERAIILDTPSYYSTPTARDREIVQPSVLTMLGWTVEHRWTVDYVTKLQ